MSHGNPIRENPTDHGIFASCDPPPPLTPFVESIWYSEGGLEHRRERILPSATADVVANIGPPIKLVCGEGDSEIRGTTTSGLLTAPMVLEHPRWHRAVGLRLHPRGIRALLGVPLSVVNDRCLSVPEVLETRFDELAERCSKARDLTRVLQIATEWALARVLRFDSNGDELAHWAARRIEKTKGAMAIRSLQEQSGYGITQFVARFKQEYGVSPKVYARLVRFRRVLEHLDENSELVQLALETGFSDQPHLHGEFRRLAGRTPTEVLASRYPSGLTLAER